MKAERSRVFAETYQGYLAEIRKIDFLSRAALLGVAVEDEALIIPLYDTVYSFNRDGVRETKGEQLTPAVQVMICKYILSCPAELPTEKADLVADLVTYREFKDSGPLTSYFTTNTNKTLESTFAGNVAGLRQRASALGGTIVSSEIYDLSLVFHAFPRIPVYLNFNDRDDIFPATCSVLYRSSAARFLDMECLAMTGTLLTGKLIGRKSM